jgi:hypothetical protein
MTAAGKDGGNQLLHGALWPRFEAYELEDGLIKPKAGAKVEWYDPWFEEEKRRAEGGGESPRNSLLRIADRIERSSLRSIVEAPSHAEWLGKKETRDLLEWCAQNGLLGLLHHQIILVRLPPSRLHFSALGWIARTELLNSEVPVDTPRGAPAPADQPPVAADPSQGIYRGIVNGDIDTEPLPGRWSRFFPDVPLEQALSSFASEKSWRLYGEPLGELVTAVTALSLALKDVAIMQASGVRSATVGQRGRYHWSFRDIAMIASVATPSPYMDEHLKPRPRWLSPSLLGSVAMLTLLDLYGGHAAVVCKNCGTVFLSKAPQAKFCTKRCRDTYHKREWRKGQFVKGDEPQ